MFRRRTPRSTLAAFGRWFWPRGGWPRAVRYMAYRLRRLPDPAYKISRGIAAGVFVCFTPFFGLHFALAAGIAWIVGGNVLASLLATFFGNPITFPIIAGLSVELGSYMMGYDQPLPLHRTFDAFSQVSVELWMNLRGLVTHQPVHWERLADFFGMVFMPYLIGGLIPGLVAALVAYVVSRPIISAYQKARISQLKKKFAKRRKLSQDSLAQRRGQGGQA